VTVEDVPRAAVSSLEKGKASVMGTKPPESIGRRSRAAVEYGGSGGSGGGRCGWR
jgi:hypothetical protein